MPTQSPTATLHRLAISGMTCGGCVNAITRTLSRVAGVATVHVTLESSSAEVIGAVHPETLLAAVRKAGYGAEVLPS